MTRISNQYFLSGESPTTPTMTERIYIGRNTEKTNYNVRVGDWGEEKMREEEKPILDNDPGYGTEEEESPLMPAKKEFKTNLIIKKIMRGKPCRG